MSRKFFFPVNTFIMKDGKSFIKMAFCQRPEDVAVKNVTVSDCKKVGWVFEPGLSEYAAVQRVFGIISDLTDHDVEIGSTVNEYAQFVLEEALVKYRFKESLKSEAVS